MLLRIGDILHACRFEDMYLGNTETVRVQQRDLNNPSSTTPLVSTVYIPPKEPDLREMLAETPLDEQIRGVDLPPTQPPPRIQPQLAAGHSSAGESPDGVVTGALNGHHALNLISVMQRVLVHIPLLQQHFFIQWAVSDHCHTAMQCSTAAGTKLSRLRLNLSTVRVHALLYHVAALKASLVAGSTCG